MIKKFLKGWIDYENILDIRQYFEMTKKKLITK